MEEVEGKNIVDKYVKKIPDTKRKPTHVGGAMPKNDDGLESYRRINKLGIDEVRD